VIAFKPVKSWSSSGIFFVIEQDDRKSKKAKKQKGKKA
jgi:hypothetical protein